MNEYKNYNRIAELISFEITDGLNSDEKDELAGWINELPENKNFII